MVWLTRFNMKLNKSLPLIFWTSEKLFAATQQDKINKHFLKSNRMSSLWICQIWLNSLFSCKFDDKLSPKLTELLFYALHYVGIRQVRSLDFDSYQNHTLSFKQCFCNSYLRLVWLALEPSSSLSTMKKWWHQQKR